MERILPVYPIEGTEFIVDVARQELREVENPANTISFLEMEDHGTHYLLRYDPDVKNLPEVYGKDIIEISIPPMAALDPDGMSLAHGLNLMQTEVKTDFEIIVNQDLVGLREKGALPVIEIAGHPFYVDIRMDCLRPKDDFSTTGIQFSAIEDCLIEDEAKYMVPYDPKAREYVELDFNTITEIPEGLIVVEIPYQSQLDPIGYARKYDLDPKDLLRAYPPEANRKARIVPWSETPIERIMERNIKRLHPESSFIVIGKEKYLLDKSGQTLTPLTDHSRKIDLTQMDKSADNSEYIGLYDVKKQTAVYPVGSDRFSSELNMLVIPVALIRNPQRKDLEVKLLPMRQPPIVKRQVSKLKNKKSKGRRI